MTSDDQGESTRDSGRRDTGRVSGGETPRHQPPDEPMIRGSRSEAPATVEDETLDTSEVVAVLAAVIPGLGQMILGQTVKGLVILGISILAVCGGGVISVASIIDAFLVAKAKKRRPVGEWEFFPDFQETFDL